MLRSLCVAGAMLVPRVVPEHDLDATRGPTARLQRAGATRLLARALAARNDELQECTLAACMHLVAAHPRRPGGDPPIFSTHLRRPPR